MSPVDRDVVRRKLARVVKSLRRLRAAKDQALSDYLADEDLQAILERHLEVIVAAAVDLNVHLLVQSGFATPADAYTSFLDLSAHTNALTRDLADKLAPSTGLRNRLAHGYDDVDPSLVYAGLHEALDLFPRYVEAVEAFLERAR